MLSFARGTTILVVVHHVSEPDMGLLLEGEDMQKSQPISHMLSIIPTDQHMRIQGREDKSVDALRFRHGLHRISKDGFPARVLCIEVLEHDTCVRELGRAIYSALDTHSGAVRAKYR